MLKNDYNGNFTLCAVYHNLKKGEWGEWMTSKILVLGSQATNITNQQP